MRFQNIEGQTFNNLTAIGLTLAIVHGALLGWIYVIYFAIRYGFHNLNF